VDSYELYHSRNHQSFLTFTGLDCAPFECLLHKFCQFFHHYSLYSVNGKVVMLREAAVKKGRLCSMDPVGCLGLVLVYTQMRGSLYLLFRVIFSVLSLFWKFLLCLLFMRGKGSHSIS
jgi:hypothetical protein